MSIILQENDYKDLYKYSLSIAYKFIGYEDSAYDIAQNAMLQLISSKTEVTSPYAWLRTVVKREALHQLEEAKRNNDITINKFSSPQPAKVVDDDSEALPKVDDKLVRKALSVEDFKIYQKFKKLDFNILKYSEKEKLSYNTASFQKKRIKRNLLSYVLWNEGWRYSTKVLNFAQFNNITRFIRTIVKSVEEKTITNLNNYLRGINPEEVQTIFSDIAECREWSIGYQEDNYRLSLVCITFDAQVKMPIFLINFDKKNYLHVLHIFEASLVMIEADNTEFTLDSFLDKGKLELSREETEDLLKYRK